MTSPFLEYSLAAVMATLIIFVVPGNAFGDSGLHVATACYGNVNNILRLNCRENERIAISEVRNGAKRKSDGCSTPASVDTYDKECCQKQSTDCTFIVVSPAANTCENKTSCRVIATWSSTNTDCDQDHYPHYTNYMYIAYSCISDRILQFTFPSETTASIVNTTTSTVHSTESTTKLSTSTTSENVITEIHIQTPEASEQQGEEEQLSDVMVGAIVAGSLGMVFTLTVFLCYWGSKRRRLRIVGKHTPTVWDYLLNQTFTVRGSRGYDQFPSVRSSVSSEGDQHSPRMRPVKNLWLPNIVPLSAGVPPFDPDALSNFENDSPLKLHRVELYPSATPSPYATLNMEPSTSGHNISPPDHHHHHLHPPSHHHNHHHHHHHNFHHDHSHHEA